jgi:adenosylcobyric acid synthase
VLIVRIVRLPNSAVPEEYEALAREPDVDLAFVDRPEDLGTPDLVILPGSKATIPDLTRMRSSGMEDAIRRAAADGALLFGICGGFQMMGSELEDPEGLEGGPPRARGLGVFDLVTRFTRDRIDEPVRARGAVAGSFLAAGAPVVGFELHGGRSVLRGDDAVPLFDEETRDSPGCPLGIATRDYAAMGTYLHGVLADPVFRGRLLEHLRARCRARDRDRSPPVQRGSTPPDVPRVD